MHLRNYIGKLVFIRLRDKRLTESFGLPTDMFLSKVVAVDPTGIWLEWKRYPLVNRNTGQKKFFEGDLFIPNDNIAAVFASETFQQDIEAQQEAARLANVEPAGEG